MIAQSQRWLYWVAHTYRITLQQFSTVEAQNYVLFISDPNDDKFLATAVAAGAGFLVSEDRDLLVLGAYQGTHIVDCRTFLRLLEMPDTGG